MRLTQDFEQLQAVTSWGRTRRELHRCRRCAFVDEVVDALIGGAGPLIAFGRGRSYGDVCLNAGGRLLLMDRLDRIVSADWSRGIVRAEAGLSLDDLLRISVPRGWFLPVAPGTKFVTLGGAVANDVHGKNHEHQGTFGCHVARLGLARSTGEILTASREKNAELFAATIGGLGLTGVILWVEIELQRIPSSQILCETLPMADLEAFFRLAQDSRDWTYTVAWVDCLAKGRDVGRGFFIRGRHAEEGGLTPHRRPRASVPIDAPAILMNSATISVFNAAYRRRPGATGCRLTHYDPFFFPLDVIGQWNRLYGRQGFFQHQCAIPAAVAADTIRRLLELTAEHGQGSFLVVLKLLGDRRSPGVLSFPLPGATLALDFPNKGESTRRLLARMTEVVLGAGGRLYPAKDATMSPAAFRAGYPDWRKVEAMRDPKINSDFWRRVTAEVA